MDYFYVRLSYSKHFKTLINAPLLRIALQGMVFALELPVKYVFYISLFILLLAGCKKEEELPFTTGSRFSYALSYTTTREGIVKYDTLTFSIEKHDITSSSPGKKEIKWENTRHDYEQIRSLNADEDHIELQLPVNYSGFANEQIVISGHPLVKPLAAVGDTLNGETKYDAGFGVLNGLKLMQHATYLRDTSIVFDGEALKCQVWESHNISQLQLGRYSVVYTYHPNYGFITMDHYYPNKKRITMQLVDISIVGK